MQLPSIDDHSAASLRDGSSATHHHMRDSEGLPFRMPAAAVPTWPEFFRGQEANPIRVLLVDDDAHIRNTVVRDLMADLRIQVVGQAGSFREGRRLVGMQAFDVLLVDLNLGDGSGLELIEHAKALRPGIEAIVISSMEDEQRVLQAFELGATGFLVKSSWFGSFAQAVLQVVNGGASITPQLARRLLMRFEKSNGGARSAPAPAEREKLSDREREVLKLVASGHTSAEVGGRLQISAQTVNSHVKNIYRKLRVKTRAQAVSYAGARGLL